MSITVQDFADELKRPVAELLMQFKEAGVSVDNAKSPISGADKLALLGYLRTKTRAPVGAPSVGASGSAVPGAPRPSITLKRKETTELRLGGARGAPTTTVSIEVRKKRTFLQSDIEEVSSPHVAGPIDEAVQTAVDEVAHSDHPTPIDDVAVAADEAVVEVQPESEPAPVEDPEAKARAEAEAEAQRIAAAAAEQARIEAAAKAKAEQDEAERVRLEHLERMKSDPIYRARMDAENSRRRAQENIARAAEASGWAAGIWEPLAGTGAPWVGVDEQFGGSCIADYNIQAILPLTDEGQPYPTGRPMDEPAEDDVDQAWDSLPPPVSAVSAMTLWSLRKSGMGNREAAGTLLTARNWATRVIFTSNAAGSGIGTTPPWPSRSDTDTAYDE